MDQVRYIVFLIDSHIKDHDGKIFCSFNEAKDYAQETITEMYADKAAVGMFVMNSSAKEMLITMVQTIGFKGDKKNASQLDLFKTYSR